MAKRGDGVLGTYNLHQASYTRTHTQTCEGGGGEQQHCKPGSPELPIRRCPLAG